MDWDNLRVFHAVLAHGSLSKAAQVLGISQPTVGRRLSELEESMGGPLFERGADGCVPTDKGRILAPLALQMDRAAHGVDQLVKTTQRDLQGVVRIATGELIGRYVAKHIGAWLIGAPELSVEIVVSQDFVNLHRGEADLAIRSKRPQSGQLFSRSLSGGHFAVYGAPSYVAANEESWDDRRYEHCRWVGYDDAHMHLPSALWLSKRIRKAPTLRFNQANLILEATAHAAGLAVLPTLIGDDDPRLTRVTEVLDDLCLEGFLVGHTRSRKLPRVRWVIDRLCEIF